MKPKLKPLSEQVIVLTGASSGIGLATARMAAERGARVVLVSRDDEDLRRSFRSAQRLAETEGFEPSIPGEGMVP